MAKNSHKYDFSEKDIEGVINFLKIADPDNADADTAIALLEELYEGFHDLGVNNPEKLLQIYADLKKNKKISN